MQTILSVYQANINSIVSTLYQKGLRHAVISPGSRNAPLIMAFARSGNITCYSVPDERAAGFIALGMCKQLQEPVAVICTSGTAVLNLYPAIAEAFYMQVPLLVITADRPAEMIGRWDGQTIRQFEVFRPHVLGSFQTTEELQRDATAEIIPSVVDFYDTANSAVKGPAHLNVPLTEPLYEAVHLEFEYPPVPLEMLEKNVKPQEEPDTGLWKFPDAAKVMILLGADYTPDHDDNLASISDSRSAVVLADIISNAHRYQNIPNWEAILLNAGEDQKKALVPDLLITSGKMVLNKTIKQLFRTNPPRHHWHIARDGFCADTFFTGPAILNVSPGIFFKQFQQHLLQNNTAYFDRFRELSVRQSEQAAGILEQGFNEFRAVRRMLRAFPEKAVIHLANSMPVRYAAYLADEIRPGWKMFSNRGVSGIDGCTSTAVGMAMLNQELNILLTGDIAFFYDINALWQRQLPANLRIVILNNFGGGIFRNIDGPSGMPELDPYMTTSHTLSAAHLASHFRTRYFSAASEAELEECLEPFLNGPGIAILEVKTDQEINSHIFKQYKSILL